MRTKDLDISKFDNIDQVYTFVDEFAYELERNWDLTDLWVKYRNKTTNEEEKQKAQWEIDCLIFEIKSEKVFPLVYSNSQKTGELKQYPDLIDFQENIIDYIQLRADKSKNPLLKSRYNHLLWKCPATKNNKYAINAIDNYIMSIEDYVKLYNDGIQEDTPFQVGKLYETLLAISNEIKWSSEPIKNLTKMLIFHSDFKFFTKHGILKDMLEYPKLFKTIDFKDTLSIFDKEVRGKKEKTDDFSFVHYYIPTAIRIATKTNSDVRKWHDKRGLAFLRIADTETEVDRFWIKLNHYSEAIKAFVLSGNTKKKTEAEQLYAELKPKVKLNSIKIDLNEDFLKNVKQFQDYIKTISENLVKKEPEEIYRTISSGSFFPKYSDVIKASENKENAFLNFVTAIHFDKNKNIAKKEELLDQKKEIFSIYSFQINWNVIPYLNNIFTIGIKSGKLTFENFIEFITTKSWIGKPHIKYDIGGVEKQIIWVDILIPSVVEFFLQMQSSFNSKYYLPSYILCVDSLTLKFEGLLRDFCERINIPTSVSTQKGMQEVNIHNVLENKIIKKYFNDDDLLFFNYLFSTDSGLNLRNNVAHCFYNYQDYNASQMFLLLAALLRLAKYDYK